MIIMNHRKCLRCGREWEAEVERPKQCPTCHSPAWDKERVRRVGAPGGTGEVEAVSKPGAGEELGEPVRALGERRVVEGAEYSQEWRPRRKG
jgi:DNA-directed RNA polymerase subunit RPC12/RpoP